VQDTKERIMAVARATAQAHGYGALSFRELAKAVGVRSASVHYHFPTKEDLGVALARRYREDAEAGLAAIAEASTDPAQCLRAYVGIFRRALENDNRMCMCGFMAAETDDLPEAVRAEVRAFADANVGWLANILSRTDGRDRSVHEARALAIYAAVSGAQLVARCRGGVAAFEAIVESYRASGLIPAGQ